MTTTVADDDDDSSSERERERERESITYHCVEIRLRDPGGDDFFF